MLVTIVEHCLNVQCFNILCQLINIIWMLISLNLKLINFFLIWLTLLFCRARGYQSTIHIQLTPDTVPASLTRVHLRIMVEGLLFTKVPFLYKSKFFCIFFYKSKGYISASWWRDFSSPRYLYYIFVYKIVFTIFSYIYWFLYIMMEGLLFTKVVFLI